MKLLRTFFLTILILFLMMFGFSASGRVFVRQLITGIDEAKGALDPTPSEKGAMQAMQDTDADGELQWIPIDENESDEDASDEGSSDEDSSDEDSSDEDSSDEGSSDEGSSGEETDDHENVEEENTDDALSRATAIVQSPVDASLYYYRTFLSEEECTLYDVLYRCATARSGEENPEVTMHIDPSEEAFHTSFSRAYNALLFDHPELFWLTMTGGVFQYSYYKDFFSADTYKVRFHLTEEFADRDERVKEFEAAAAALLSEIDLTQSKPRIAMQIHDALIERVSYDKVLVGSDEADLAHTAYGALVCNSRGEACTAVCDGYSYAYEYLLQKVGIPCIVVAGRAGEYPESAGSHSWNLVKLDDDWYEVDSTWNDITVGNAETDGDSFSDLAAEALIDDEYMDLLHHFLFNVTTDEITHFVPDEQYRYTTILGWVSFLSESVHVRHTGDEAADTGDYMSQYAPIAEGRTYTYRALTQ